MVGSKKDITSNDDQAMVEVKKDIVSNCDNVVQEFKGDATTKDDQVAAEIKGDAAIRIDKVGVKFHTNAKATDGPVVPEAQINDGNLHTPLHQSMELNDDQATTDETIHRNFDTKVCCDKVFAWRYWPAVTCIMTMLAILALITIPNRSSVSSVSSEIPKISTDCLKCICQSNGCKEMIGNCIGDGGSMSCGPYQIRLSYWIDCGCPNNDGKSCSSLSPSDQEREWRKCTTQMECSERCVVKYMERYARACSSPVTCEVFARVHAGGPNGCRSDSTLEYLNNVAKCCKGNLC